MFIEPLNSPVIKSVKSLLESSLFPIILFVLSSASSVKSYPKSMLSLINSGIFMPITEAKLPTVIGKRMYFTFSSFFAAGASGFFGAGVDGVSFGASLWMSAFGGVAIDQVVNKVGELGANGLSDLTLSLFYAYEALPLTTVLSFLSVVHCL